MPARFRGHIQLVLDPKTGKVALHACKLCERACPSDCIAVDGAKLEGQKRKSVTDYQLDFTTCSLCAPASRHVLLNAIEFSKEYNVVAFSRDAFNHMDLVQRLAARREIWAAEPARPPRPAAEPPSPAPVRGACPRRASRRTRPSQDISYPKNE